MITIFGIPKPFIGEFDVIQRNAILSWLKLQPACEVILLGNEKGVAEFAAENHIKHIPTVDVSTFGTPLIADAHKKVKEAARFSIHAYINSDIILMQDFIDAVIKVKDMPSFFIGGQRTDTDIKTPIDFNNSDWQQNIKAIAKRAGSLHGP